MARYLIMAATCLALGACATPRPSPLAPPQPPSAWREASGELATAAAQSPDWWRQFDQPAFARLVERAGAVTSVRIAEARLDAAQAQLRLARAALAPNIRYDALGSIAQNGDDAIRQDTGRGSLALLWDADLNGQNRNRRAAALEETAAAGADIAAERLSARSSAARLYVSYAESRRQSAIAQGTADVLRAALMLADSRSRAGLASTLDVVQARAALRRAEALVPQYDASARAAALGLESLLGEKPGGLDAQLQAIDRIPVATAIPALATPLAVVRTRPDLVAAQYRLMASGYLLTAAERGRWPTLSISGIIGAQSLSFQTAFGGAGLIRSAAGELSGPLLDFGRTRATIDSARSDQRAAALAYGQAILDAFKEVETALAEQSAAARQVATLREAAAAAAEEVSLARARYTSGLSPLLNVLTAEQGRFEAESNLASAEARGANAVIALSTALGLDPR